MQVGDLELNKLVPNDAHFLSGPNRFDHQHWQKVPFVTKSSSTTKKVKIVVSGMSWNP
jgi:hypothetical protein